jgi:hypothetical protein
MSSEADHKNLSMKPTIFIDSSENLVIIKNWCCICLRVALICDGLRKGGGGLIKYFMILAKEFLATT